MPENEHSKVTLEATAYWTAAVRARESGRAGGLLHDPYAGALAGEPGAAWLAQRSEDSTLPIVLRTRYFDDFLQQCAGQAGIRQIVLMAAGLDTRAFRLAWPAGTHIFELDQPAVLQYKDEVLHSLGAQPAAERYVIAKDLTEPWDEALLASGFDPSQRSCWLLEGFLFYLLPEAVVRLLEQVSPLAAPGSRLGFDIINGAMLTSPWTRAWIEMQAELGAPWTGTMEDPVEFLARLGWKATLTQAGQPEAHHGRWTLPVLPVHQAGIPHNWFVTAEKEGPAGF